MAAFFGAAELLTHGFLDPVAVVPLLVGMALIVTLVVYEYRARHPLLILRALATTIPVTGVVVAICAAAAATSAIALTATVQAPRITRRCTWGCCTSPSWRRPLSPRSCSGGCSARASSTTTP